MGKLFGQKLLEGKIITEKQLAEAVERQRLHGGRLGQNLIALGVIKKNELDKIFRTSPPAPRTVEETGLELSTIEDLTNEAYPLHG